MNLREKYEKEARPALQKEFDIANAMAVPEIGKIVVNMGTGESLRNKETAEKIIAELAAITGQKPKVTRARVSIAGFNVREGMPVGVTVTLRKKRMYDFLTKLISVVLPRLRDFRGVSDKSFDGRGNYTLGVVEHTVFPEIDITKIDKPRGMEITIVIERSAKEQSKRLLEILGMPFEKAANSAKA